ncbi:MAG: hypothetical protein ACRERE_17660 [Candidatus Entotheonellia bacterium]
MAQSRETLIAQLCDSWLAVVQQPGGVIAIGPAAEAFRLTRNGINFHELDYAEIQASCVGLMRVLLLKGLSAVIDPDHQLFWAWIGELLLSSYGVYFTQQESEIRELFDACIRASLTGSQAAPPTQAEWEEQQRIAELTDFNTRQLGRHAHLILASLCLPFLEATVKKVCAAYVDYAGNVKVAFSVPRPGGARRNYNPLDPRNNKCSSLRDLLHLLLDSVADADLQERLREVRRHLQTLDNSVDPFDLIYSWRNQSLHGQASFPTIGGTVLNLSILIALNQLRSQYEKLRDRAWQKVQFDATTYSRTRMRLPSSYYPPF